MTKAYDPAQAFAEWMEEFEILEVTLPCPGKVMMRDLSGINEPFIMRLMHDEGRALQDMLGNIKKSSKTVNIESMSGDTLKNVTSFQYTDSWNPIRITPKKHNFLAR